MSNCEKCDKDICFSKLIHSYRKYICPTCFQKDFSPPYFKTSDGVDINIGEELFFIDVSKDGNVEIGSSKSIGYSNNYTNPPEVFEFPRFICDGSGASIALENGRVIYSDYLTSSFKAAVALSKKQCKENVRIARSFMEKKKKAYSKKIKGLRESHKKDMSSLGAKKEKWTKALENVKKLV